MKRLPYILSFLFLFINGLSKAQIVDSVAQKYLSQIELDTIPAVEEIDSTALTGLDLLTQDSTSEKKKKKPRKPKEERFLYKQFKLKYPNPKFALWSGFIVPGMGQIYNKSWWKVPLVYGGLGFALYQSIDNTRKYRIFRDAYIAELAGEAHAYSGSRFDAGDLKRIRDGYDKNRQNSYLAVIGVYIIAGAEAFVDAHLKTFDVSEDLSINMKLKPSIETNAFQEPIMGVGLSFTLDKKKRSTPNSYGLLVQP